MLWTTPAPYLWRKKRLVKAIKTRLAGMVFKKKKRYVKYVRACEHTGNGNPEIPTSFNEEILELCRSIWGESSKVHFVEPLVFVVLAVQAL